MCKNEIGRGSAEKTGKRKLKKMLKREKKRERVCVYVCVKEYSKISNQLAKIRPCDFVCISFVMHYPGSILPTNLLGASHSGLHSSKRMAVAFNKRLEEQASGCEDASA
jgi:hypothetical protein